MIGDGANGKSTFINVINKLLGMYGMTAASQTLIANGGNSIGDDLVDLIGARLITVSETEEGQSLAEAKIKQMTGGDRLKGRPLYGSHIQFNIIGKLWLATNSLPQINNTDHGIWRLIKAIPFNRTFSAEEQDKSLSDKLMEELPGILNWAIEGCLEWKGMDFKLHKLLRTKLLNKSQRWIALASLSKTNARWAKTILTLPLSFTKPIVIGVQALAASLNRKQPSSVR